VIAAANRMNRDANSQISAFDAFTLSPMSAGDIIDRAVRLYKRNLFVLMRIVLGPSLVAYAGSILFSIGWRNFTLMRGDSRVATTMLLLIAGGLLWVVGEAAFYAVLGASSRALVGLLAEGKPIRAREVYASVRERIWSLIGATFMIVLIVLAVSWFLIIAIGIVVMLVAAVAAKLIPMGSGWLSTLVSILYMIIMGGLLLLSFLLVYSRLVYVPQILMVERKGIFSAISRSFQLARGEMFRIAAVVIFWIYVAWSVWVMMAVPVEWYAYTAGVDITPFNADVPLWYQIAKQTLTQLSEILIWPIAMLCFTLLYLNSRVRKEGYDIEVMANRALAAPPIPQAQVAPQEPAAVYVPPSSVPSILGLNDYRPAAVNVPALDLNAAAVPAASVPFEPAFPAAEPRLETETPPALPLEPATPPLARGAVTNAPAKSCSWCGSEAGVQDRFCRVCGSVF
jgi:hypothetical protein